LERLTRGGMSRWPAQGHPAIIRLMDWLTLLPIGFAAVTALYAAGWVFKISE